MAVEGRCGGPSHQRWPELMVEFNGGQIGEALRWCLPARAAGPLIGIGNFLMGERELRILRSVCTKGTVAVDVGANYGAYSFWLGRIYERVVAFEPVEECARFLENAFPKVDTIRAALGDRNGNALLEIDERDGKIVTTEARIRDDSRTSTGAPRLREVSMRTLDSYKFEDVGFIKIDVEGHELAVLRGAEGTLEAFRPSLIIECEERHREGALDSVREFLGRFGYSCYVIVGKKLVRVEDLMYLRKYSTVNFVFVSP